MICEIMMFYKKIIYEIIIKKNSNVGFIFINLTLLAFIFLGKLFTVLANLLLLLFINH